MVTGVRDTYSGGIVRLMARSLKLRGERCLKMKWRIYGERERER